MAMIFDNYIIGRYNRKTHIEFKKWALMNTEGQKKLLLYDEYGAI